MKIIQDTFNLEHVENKWELIRERDKLKKQSIEILFLEFNKDGTYKSKHNEIKIGRCLIMSPFNKYFTWQTTLITEIIEETVCFYHFKTTNSVYKLIKINSD